MKTTRWILQEDVDASSVDSDDAEQQLFKKAEDSVMTRSSLVTVKTIPDEIYDLAFKLIAGELAEEDASDEIKTARKAILDGSWLTNSIA